MTGPRPLPSHRREWRACPHCTAPAPLRARICERVRYPVYRVTLWLPYRVRWAICDPLFRASHGCCAVCRGSHLRRAR